MVDTCPYGLFETPELGMQPRGLELLPYGTNLADVDPPNPEVLFEEMLQKGEIQIEGLLRFARRPCDEVETGQELRQAVLPTLPAHSVDHADGLEASVRVDVKVVRLRDYGVRGLEAEGEEVARGRVPHQEAEGCHRLVRMGDHHRGVAVVRVEDPQSRCGVMDAVEQRLQDRHVDLRGR